MDTRSQAPDQAGADVQGLAPVEHKEPYSSLAVLATSLGLAAVPVISLLGHRREAVIWLALEVLVLTLVRSRRVHGSWISARGRLFDVLTGALLTLGLLVLAYYADLPRIV